MDKNNINSKKVDLKAEIVDLIVKNYGSQAELARVMGEDKKGSRAYVLNARYT